MPAAERGCCGWQRTYVAGALTDSNKSGSKYISRKKQLQQEEAVTAGRGSYSRKQQLQQEEAVTAGSQPYKNAAGTLYT
jgi:hypothetical protein